MSLTDPPLVIIELNHEHYYRTLQVAAQMLRDAHVAEAEAFLRHRINAPTDNQARAMAVIETKSEVDIAAAEYEIAKAMLQLAVREK